MVKKLFFYTFCLSAISLSSFTSCSDDADSNNLPVNNDIQALTIGGKQVDIIDGTLSFNSESDLIEASKVLKPLIRTKSSDGSLLVDESKVTELRKNGFQSLYDVYQAAMNEAESYYDREGGYEEFKAKYSCLYFPEEGDDYSAYLPISDKKIAMLADANGKVFLSNNLVSLVDISNYQQLVDLGQTPPGGMVTKASRGDVVTGTNSISEQKVGENKVWISSKTGMDGMIPYVRVDVCFRKKGFLGIWYNHNSNTEAALVGRGGLKMYAGRDHESMTWQQGMSSHDYYYAIDGLMPGTPWTIPVNQIVEINHWGTGLLLRLTCKYASFHT